MSKNKMNAEYIAEKLDISYEEALEVIEFDKAIDKAGAKPIEGEVTVVKAAPKKKGGITEDDINRLAEVIKENFAGKSFQNKDLVPYLADLGLTNRQTPSRLKKLAEMGVLKDTGGTPKKYELQ